MVGHDRRYERNYNLTNTRFLDFDDNVPPKLYIWINNNNISMSLKQPCIHLMSNMFVTSIG